MRCSRCLTILCSLIASLGLAALGVLATPAQEPKAANTASQSVPASQAPAGKTWALVIGINYEGAAPPRLRNPEKDAADLYEVLCKHYGFERDKTIQLLVGAKATGETIRKQLGGSFLSDPLKVQEDDSVLVYYAGHGDRIQTEGAPPTGAILPYDLRYQLRRPALDTVLRFHEDLVYLLQKSPARQKLLILDCCHSGEIFARPVAVRSQVDHRRDPVLATLPAVQAFASCRAVQEANDGTAGNSPFAAALIKALRTLPNSTAHAGFHSFLTITDVFHFTKRELARSTNDGQSPDLRNLTADDGEFRFLPKMSTFADIRPEQIDFKLLQAMVPGEHGNWWFDEVPWLIPSLRQAILEKSAAGKRNLYLQALSRAELKKAARLAQQELQERVRQQPEDKLSALRLKHLLALQEASRAELKEVLQQIIVELGKEETLLEAPDLHLLATLKHRLDAPDAEQCYDKALRRYEHAREMLALMALCHADRGYYLFDVKNENERAAEAFQAARGLFGAKESPAPFQIFTLCREADAWQRLGRWGVALSRLQQALSVASGMDPEHQSALTAHVYSRRGWALMEQWKFLDATRAFQESSRILDRDKSNDPKLIFDSAPDALVLWFHNRHGLAMSKRFQGDPQGAAGDFRQIANDLSKSLQLLREDVVLDQSLAEIRGRLAARLTNTLERLVDCNLFGEGGDLREAAADAQRVLAGKTASASQRPAHVGMLYKQALILSLPSPAQDLELAEAYCKRAQDLEVKLIGKQTQLLECPRRLAPPLVALSRACADKPDDGEKRRAALAKLRTEIEALTREARANDSRDDLEFLMFATRLLLREAVPGDRFETLLDADLLQSLCRRALRSRTCEALRYLRPYYDSVLTAKLRLRPQHVKNLLEVHWEATQGSAYYKPAQQRPTLALYVLDQQCHLLLDVPGGTSKHYPLDPDDYAPARLVQAMTPKEPLAALALPRAVERELQKLSAGGKGAALRFLWNDPALTGFQAREANSITLALPFRLPVEVRVVDAVPAAALSNVGGN